MTRRCDNCRKKVNLISFECKCNYKTLCNNCKLPEYHNCQSLQAYQDITYIIILKII